MKNDNDGPWWEIYYTAEQWDRFAFKQWQWRSHETPEEAEERLQTEHEMSLVVLDFTALVLTPRQQQVVDLYCLEGRTQQEVANILGISQQTVSQHLMGKLRGGRQIGGAFHKLRKAIHTAASARTGQSNRRARILWVFDNLLDSSITRRRARELIGVLVREGRIEFQKEK